MASWFSRNRAKYPSCQVPFYQQIQRDAFANMNQQQYLRPMVNLKPWMTAVEDQGEFNSW
jgi:hypothetical protein